MKRLAAIKRRENNAIASFLLDVTSEDSNRLFEHVIPQGKDEK